MVKISYCPNCQKAYRFHLKSKMMCSSCKGSFEIVEVPRTKYFLIQLPLLVIGFVVICYSIILLSFQPTRLAEPIGYFILGFSLVLFALAFQIMDSKTMEAQGREAASVKLSPGSKDERVVDEPLPLSSFRIKSEKLKSGKTVQTEIKSFSPDDLFVQPNRPSITVKKPKPKKEEKPIKVTQLRNILKTKPGQKRARKIRRAI